MPICSGCGQQNPDNSLKCYKCGVPFAHQVRVSADAKRAKTLSMLRLAAWMGALIVAVIVGPSVYRAAGTAYLKYHLESTKKNAMIDCGGPVTDSTYAYEREKIEKCFAKNTDVIKAEQDYANFTK